jgi:lactoylglutathione lyase
MKFGYTIIFVEDIAKTVEFYQTAFGLEAQTVTPMFAQMKTGDVSLAFGANSNERHELAGVVDFRDNTPDQDPAGIQISFVSKNVEADFARAIKAGATSVIEPNVKPWGQTVSRVRDLNGVLVGIVSALKF